MKKIQFILIALFITFGSATILSAQDQFTIFAGGSFPISDFGSEDINNSQAGGANNGVNFGLKYVHQLKEEFGLTVGIDFSNNGLKPQVKENAKTLLIAGGVNDPEIDFYKYWNIPVSAGLNLKTSISKMTDLYFDACVALNFLKVTDMEVVSNKQKVRTSFDWTSHLGYKIGMGFLVTDKIALSLNYFSLGVHNLHGTVVSAGNKNEGIDGEVKVDFISVTFGILLK